MSDGCTFRDLCSRDRDKIQQIINTYLGCQKENEALKKQVQELEEQLQNLEGKYQKQIEQLTKKLQKQTEKADAAVLMKSQLQQSIAIEMAKVTKLSRGVQCNEYAARPPRQLKQRTTSAEVQTQMVPSQKPSYKKLQVPNNAEL